MRSGEKQKKIVLLTGSHLCHNPRVIKEATALANAGFHVTVLGAWLDALLKERDQAMIPSVQFTFCPVIDMSGGRNHGLIPRTRLKLGTKLKQAIGIENRWQLGYAYTHLRKAAHRTIADLYVAHSEQAMAVAVDLARAGNRVGVDMEDWFSDDLPANTRKWRPVQLLRHLEGILLTSGVHATCPSHAMSEALGNEFGCPPPTAIYNAFPLSDRASIDALSRDRKDRRLPSIHWFSQTLGFGRGLEDMINAMPILKHDAELHLRGNAAPGFETWLSDRLPDKLRKRVIVHRLVSNAELLSRIAEHDIGFAGEIPSIRSRDLTITNKALQYLLGGLAVVASDTAGHREVAAQASNAVFLYPSGDYTALAARLEALLTSNDMLNRAKSSAVQAATRTFCWERQEKSFLDSIDRALSRDHLAFKERRPS